MSTALAIAGVTAVLRDMLDAWLTDQDANAALNGGNAEVTALAPDTVKLTGAEAAPQLNLFLHQVSQNSGWRNADLPSRDSRGERLTRPPLALDLHYLLTAYGPLELQAEVLLGYGMQLLHELPVLPREEIEDRLPAALRDCNVARQLELIKVTPETMSTDDLSRLWSALHASYRPTASYRVSVVLIQPEPEGRAALPVLTRGRIVATTELEPALPGISAVRPPNEQPVAILGDTVAVEGHHFGGSNQAVILENRQLGIVREVAAIAGAESGVVRFKVPQLSAALAVGTYTVRVLVQRPGEATRRESNELSLTIGPHVTTAFPVAVARDGSGTASVTLDFRPNRRPHQPASIVVGSREVPADAVEPSAATGTLTFTIEDAPPGTHLLRLRIDGVDSLLVDRSVTPPAFFDRRVVIA